MMERLVIAVLIFLAFITAPAQSAGDGCVVATSDLVASLASATTCLDVPAGTYTVAPTGGNYLAVTTNNLSIRGAGIGKTVIQTTGVTLAGNLYIFRLLGAGQSISDLTIQIGAGYSGGQEVGAISVGAGATRATIERVEVSGGYTGNGGNGFAIGLYQPYNQNNGRQDSRIEGTYLHDMPTTAIGVNSSGNLITGNRIARIGTTNLQHAFYAQGGGNVYSGNIAEVVSGFCYHGWKKVPNLDGSGDRVIGNTFINCASGPGIVSGMPNSANPALPVGANLSRDAIFSGNTFRGAGVLSVSIPSSINANVFEGTRLELAAGSDGSQAVNNRFASFTLLGLPAIKADAPVLVQANTIDMNGYATGISVAGNGTQVRDNRITRNAAGTGDWMTGIYINANDVDISGNYININGAQLLGPGAAPAGLRVHDNTLITTRFVMRDSVKVVSGLIYDNRWVGQFNGGAGLTFRDNDGVVT